MGSHQVSHAAAGAVCEAERAEGWVEGQDRPQGPCCTAAAAQAAPAARQPHPAPGLQWQLHWHRVCAHAALPVLLLVGSCTDISTDASAAASGLSDALLPAVRCNVVKTLTCSICLPCIVMLHTRDRVLPYLHQNTLSFLPITIYLGACMVQVFPHNSCTAVEHAAADGCAPVAVAMH